MRRWSLFTEIMATAINLALFLILVYAFVMVFWFPEQAGEMMGKLVKGFMDVFGIKEL